MEASINYQNVMRDHRLQSMYDYMADPVLTYTGSAPTFNDIRASHGKDGLTDWMAVLLYELSSFCGSRDRFGFDQCRQAAMLIGAKYNIRATEFLAFVALYKAGTFGDAKGFASGTTICNALDHYLNDYKPRQLARIEDEQSKSDATDAQDSTSRGLSALREYMAEARANGNEPSDYLRYIAGETNEVSPILKTI